MTQQNSALVEQATVTTLSFQEEVTRLTKAVDRFKLRVKCGCKHLFLLRKPDRFELHGRRSEAAFERNLFLVKPKQLAGPPPVTAYRSRQEDIADRAAAFFAFLYSLGR